MFMIWTSAIASDHLDEWSTIDGKKRRLLSSLAASSHEASESLSRALFSRTSHNTKKGDYTEKQPKIALGVLGNGSTAFWCLGEAASLLVYNTGSVPWNSQ